jgi:hypothetical protein
MKRTTFTFSREPRDDLYGRLLEAALTQAKTLGLIVQKRRTYPSSAIEVLDRLSPYLIEKRNVTEWPGTRLVPGYVEELRIYRYDSAVKHFLEFVADGLFDWQNPDLPDDLHFLRSDESTWLGSIAHESDAWLELTSAEHAQLGEIAPQLTAILRAEA